MMDVAEYVLNLTFGPYRYSRYGEQQRTEAKLSVRRVSVLNGMRHIDLEMSCREQISSY